MHTFEKVDGLRALSLLFCDQSFVVRFNEKGARFTVTIKGEKKEWLEVSATSIDYIFTSGCHSQGPMILGLIRNKLWRLVNSFLKFGAFPEDCYYSVRLGKIMQEYGIRTIRQALDLAADNVKNMGRKTTREIIEIVSHQLHDPDFLID